MKMIKMIEMNIKGEVFENHLTLNFGYVTFILSLKRLCK